MLLPVTSRSTEAARRPLKPVLNAMTYTSWSDTGSVNLFDVGQGNGTHTGKIEGNGTALTQGHTVHIGTYHGAQLLRAGRVRALRDYLVRTRRQRIAVAVLAVPAERHHTGLAAAHINLAHQLAALVHHRQAQPTGRSRHFDGAGYLAITTQNPNVGWRKDRLTNHCGRLQRLT